MNRGGTNVLNRDEYGALFFTGKGLPSPRTVNHKKKAKNRAKAKAAKIARRNARD